MRIGWSTDMHLDRISTEERDVLFQQNSIGVDKWLLTGDTSSGRRLLPDFQAIQDQAIHTYYVLGNHEYYWNNFAAVQRHLTQLGPNTVYLTKSEPIELTNRTVLIGDDGWYDGRMVVPLTNWIFSIDFMMISDFWLEDGGKERLALMRQLAWESTERLTKKIKEVRNDYQKIILATHFSPFRQPRFHSLVDRFYTPYNTNHFLGQSLRGAMNGRKSKLLILAGHTHIENAMNITDNIICLIGAARKQVMILA